MNHQEVRKRMGDYLQGELTLAQRALFDAHLDGCTSCADELHTLRITVDLLRGLDTPEVPPHLTDRVFARIQDGEGQARWLDGLSAFWDAIDPARYLPPLAAAALTSAVVIVGVRDLGWQIPGTHPPGTQVVAQASRTDADPAPVVPRRSPPETAAAADRAAAGRAMASGFSSELRLPAATQIAEREAGALRFEVQERLGEPPAAFVKRPFGARAAPPALGVGSVADALGHSLAPHSLAEDLELALMDPRAFLEHHRAQHPVDAREAWLSALADEATRRGSLDDLLLGLRERAGAEGEVLAGRFEDVARR